MTGFRVVVSRIPISIVLLLTMSVAGYASRPLIAPVRSAREVLANQPDFVADLIASDGSGERRYMRLAKKGNLFRLDYRDGGRSVFVDSNCALWELDAQTATARPEGTIGLISLHAPWLLFALVAKYPCISFNETRDRRGRLVTVEVYVPGGADSPMVCSVSGQNGLVTRVEFSGYKRGESGYRLYELKNVQYRVPRNLFSVPLAPQSDHYSDDPCLRSGAA